MIEVVRLNHAKRTIGFRVAKPTASNPMVADSSKKGTNYSRSKLLRRFR